MTVVFSYLIGGTLVLLGGILLYIVDNASFRSLYKSIGLGGICTAVGLWPVTVCFIAIAFAAILVNDLMSKDNDR